MAAEKEYLTVSQLSASFGVSVRTLHHYDNIGLLKAKRDSNNGYRIYSPYQVALLQQILQYRSMGMSLKQIEALVLSADFDLYHALKEHRQHLLSQKADLNKVIKQVENTMSVLKGEENLSILLDKLPDEQVHGFIETIKQEEDGNEIMEAYAKIPEGDFEKEKQILDEWTESYMKVTHLPVSDPQVQELIKEAYVIMNRMFYRSEKAFQGASYSMVLEIVALGREDEVTVNIYEAYQVGLAKHYFDAMIYFAEHSLKGNEESYVHMQ
jgi:DNA-binding transcriptional MerR regulator